MRKILVLLALALICGSASAYDNLSAFYTDFFADGADIDSTGTKSVYFQVENPLLDSVVTYFEQYASTHYPTIACTLYSTVDDISPRGSYTLDSLAAKAHWTTVAEVFSAVSTESTVIYTGITQANLIAKFGRWFKMVYTAGATEAVHDATSKILHAGVIKLRMPD